MIDVLNKLEELGYKSKLIEYKDYYDIIVDVNSFYTFNNSHKSIIRNMVGEDLMEFYYGGNQHIYIKKNIIKERIKKINKLCSKFGIK